MGDGHDALSADLIAHIKSQILASKTPVVAAVAWQTRLMKDIETAIEKWAVDDKPDVRTVMSHVYHMRDFRRMLYTLNDKPKKRKKKR